MIGEEFKVGDIVRILDPKEMLENIRTVEPEARRVDDYDVVENMQHMGGVTAKIVSHATGSWPKTWFMQDKYDLVHLDGTPISYMWYKYCITSAEKKFDVPLDEWSGLL